MKLSDPKVKKAKPETKPYKMADGGGMYVEVMPCWRALKAQELCALNFE
jgi:hypothetical protein